jgi:uncharacterized membrane protein
LSEERLREVGIQLSALGATLDHHTVQLRDISTKIDSLMVTTTTLHAARNAERRLVIGLATLISTAVSLVALLL